MARPPKFDDDEIVRRAMLAFWQHGWAGTSIRELEAALELTAPTIYRRFGSKEGVFVAALEYYLDEVIGRRIDAHLTDAPDPRLGLWTFVVSALDDSSTARIRGCLLTSSANEVPLLPDEPARAVQTGLRRIRRSLVAAADEAVAAGSVDATDGSQLGEQVAVALQGLLVLSRSGASRDVVRRHARHALAVVAPD